MSTVSKAFSIQDLQNAARRRLPRAIFDFFDGGAEDEITLIDNQAAFRRTRLLPKVLNDVSQVSTAVDILGMPSALPLAIAPTGAVGFGWHGGDIAIARAAVAANIPYTLSSAATTSIEQVAEAAPGRLWFQAYILKNKPFLDSLIARALAAEYEALMITVDLPVGGKRERDFRNHFSVPFHFTAKNIFDFSLHPRWLLDMIFHGMPVMENMVGLDMHAKNTAAIASSVGRSYDPSFDWDALKKIRDQWPRKLIIKGVLHPEDAKRLATMGCDALVVSNHGGRQLDGAVASLDALPGVLAGVEGRVPVFLDGGIRRGSDIFKAIALGAAGVLVGRATLYGAISGGEAGAHRALAILRDELIRTMQLSGARSVADINSELLF